MAPGVRRLLSLTVGEASEREVVISNRCFPAELDRLPRFLYRFCEKAFLVASHPEVCVTLDRTRFLLDNLPELLDSSVPTLFSEILSSEAQRMFGGIYSFDFNGDGLFMRDVCRESGSRFFAAVRGHWRRCNSAERIELRTRFRSLCVIRISFEEQFVRLYRVRPFRSLFIRLRDCMLQYRRECTPRKPFSESFVTVNGAVELLLGKKESDAPL